MDSLLCALDARVPAQGGSWPLFFFRARLITHPPFTFLQESVVGRLKELNEIRDRLEAQCRDLEAQCRDLQRKAEDERDV